MGDISRHLDVFLNTKKVIPKSLLNKCNLTESDLTYLELGNYFTDVSQFRDPVFYIFAKRRIWRDFVLLKAEEKVLPYRILFAALALTSAGFGTHALVNKSNLDKYFGVATGTSGALALGTYATNLLADWMGVDQWIDKMFGTPIEKLRGNLIKREENHYGLVGQFFKHFIEGFTHMLFAQEVSKKISSNPDSWGGFSRIPEKRITDIYSTYYTQYFPHEHTDQPAFIFDASKRSDNPKIYGFSKRGGNLNKKQVGVMNIVDKYYIQYLSEGLTNLEIEYRKFKLEDNESRQNWLIKMGKLLHGIEDWFFHSNVVELIKLRKYRPKSTETDEEILKNFITKISKEDKGFKRNLDKINNEEDKKKEIIRRKRVLYRRLRFPTYKKGNKENRGGIISETNSTLRLHNVYPAFPSHEDTPHTLLHALKNLEGKFFPTSSDILSKLSSKGSKTWFKCILQKLKSEAGDSEKDLKKEKANARKNGSEKSIAVIIDALREWIPLIVTLLYEDERKRLVAGIDPLKWPSKEIGSKKEKDNELEKQLELHKKALKPQLNQNGLMENNYEKFARYMTECEFLNEPGRRAIVEAFNIDKRSEKLDDIAPGCGGFLIRFAVDLQRNLDDGIAQMNILNKNKDSVFHKESRIRLGKKTKDNKGVVHEIIGSHSLMSKDTTSSQPFFKEATVLASVASQFVFYVMLEQVSKPKKRSAKIYWKDIVKNLIRYPPSGEKWEQQALNFYLSKGNNIDNIGILINNSIKPELFDLIDIVKNARKSGQSKISKKSDKTMDEILKKRYLRIEKEVSEYRYSFF